MLNSGNTPHNPLIQTPFSSYDRGLKYSFGVNIERNNPTLRETANFPTQNQQNRAYLYKPELKPEENFNFSKKSENPLIPDILNEDWGDLLTDTGPEQEINPDDGWNSMKRAQNSDNIPKYDNNHNFLQRDNSPRIEKDPYEYTQNRIASNEQDEELKWDKYISK